MSYLRSLLLCLVFFTAATVAQHECSGEEYSKNCASPSTHREFCDHDATIAGNMIPRSVCVNTEALGFYMGSGDYCGPCIPPEGLYIAILYPSVSPSDSPTDIPSVSQVPSDVPSLLATSPPREIDITATPTATISEQPSGSFAPSVAPSGKPSGSSLPSGVPSLGPSSVPSALPSDGPSGSFLPSLVPSDGPSGSSFPSSEPSESGFSGRGVDGDLIAAPSPVPSDVPSGSHLPSTIPSGSSLPSLAPSGSSFPSSEPSEAGFVGGFGGRGVDGSLIDAPSPVPSDVPSGSHLPSSVPSDDPSSGETFLPSLMPSGSSFPSSEPSESGVDGRGIGDSFDVPSPVPSDVPSGSHLPSSVPSGSHMPSGIPSTLPSALPSGLPSGSSLPSEIPSFSPSDNIILQAPEAAISGSSGNGSDREVSVESPTAAPVTSAPTDPPVDNIVAVETIFIYGPIYIDTMLTPEQIEQFASEIMDLINSNLPLSERATVVSSVEVVDQSVAEMPVNRNLLRNLRGKLPRVLQSEEPFEVTFELDIKGFVVPADGGSYSFDKIVANIIADKNLVLRNNLLDHQGIKIGYEL